MKKLLLITALVCSAFISHAQTAKSLADSAFAKHDYVKAYEYYTDALKVDTNNITYLRRAGFCLMNCEGQELNATRFFASALKLSPNDPVSNYYLGVIYMDAAKSETDKAKKANFKALAQSHLSDASKYGNKDANAAIKDLNAI